MTKWMIGFKDLLKDSIWQFRQWQCCKCNSWCRQCGEEDNILEFDDIEDTKDTDVDIDFEMGFEKSESDEVNVTEREHSHGRKQQSTGLSIWAVFST